LQNNLDLSEKENDKKNKEQAKLKNDNSQQKAVLEIVKQYIKMALDYSLTVQQESFGLIKKIFEVL